MGQLQEPIPDFAALYANPSIERMLTDLSDHQFEHFVKYVFEQAGYFVEDTAWQRGSGLDLKLYTGPSAAPTLHAGVQVKQLQAGSAVTAPDIQRLRGGVSNTGSTVGYFVTTSTFVGPALREANGTPQILPLDGELFLRYIAYVRGSRPLIRAQQSPRLQPIERPPSYPLVPVPPEALFAAEKITRRPALSTKVLTVANHKGGVGKTTTALNLAFGLMAKPYNQQILLVDMDPQANLTRMLSSPHAQNATHMHLGEYFAGERRLAELIRPTQFGAIWLIPSGNALTRGDTGVAAGPDAELRFVRDLHAPDIVPPPFQSAHPFDWIIIDTGPSMGLFARSALAASHYALMPIAPGVFADMGLDLLLETIGTMEALTGVSIRLMGALVTQWREDRLNQDLLAAVVRKLDAAGVQLFPTKIPLDKANIERAHIETGQGRTRMLFDRRCASARAYATLVAEVVSDVIVRGDHNANTASGDSDHAASAATPRRRSNKKPAPSVASAD